MKMDLSFREKSLWLMFATLVATFGFYFLTVLPPSAADVVPQQVVLFIVAVVLLVIVQIVGHAVIAIMDRRTDTDEREQLIELKGTRNASYVLATGVFLALCAAMVSDGNFVFTHLLLAFWVLAQLVEIGSQLVLHRRGA
jgi:hypothetical protein